MALQGRTIKQSQGAAEEAGPSRPTNEEDPSQVTYREGMEMTSADGPEEE